MHLFKRTYFNKYKKKNILGIEKGERPFLYLFWCRKLRKILPVGAKVLEVGCGGGYFLKWLEENYKPVGLDISESALSIAKNKTTAPLCLGSAEKLSFDDNSFSGIIAFDVIEHLKTPENFFKEAFRIISKNGFLIISTPNPESFGSRIKQHKPEWKGLPYEKRALEWYGWRDETHINVKSIDEWRSILQENGFKIFRDGTDTLWDVPYFKNIPFILQKLFFIPIHWILTWLFGFFPWRYGENYICIAMKL